MGRNKFSPGRSSGAGGMSTKQKTKVRKNIAKVANRTPSKVGLPESMSMNRTVKRIQNSKDSHGSRGSTAAGMAFIQPQRTARILATHGGDDTLRKYSNPRKKK